MGPAALQYRPQGGPWDDRALCGKRGDRRGCMAGDPWTWDPLSGMTVGRLSGERRRHPKQGRISCGATARGIAT